MNRGLIIIGPVEGRSPCRMTMPRLPGGTFSRQRIYLSFHIIDGGFQILIALIMGYYPIEQMQRVALLYTVEPAAAHLAERQCHHLFVVFVPFQVRIVALAQSAFPVAQ